MLEKTLKFAALPFSVMAFALTYIYFVETLNYHSLFAGALALIIATATCIVYLFSLLQLPSMIYFLVKDSYKVWKLGKVKFGKKDECAPSIDNITLQDDKSKEIEVNQKFKHADKHKVMNRHSACQFAKNAFPNIVTQAHTFVYAKLVQYDEYNKIESFKKEML